MQISISNSSGKIVRVRDNWSKPRMSAKLCHDVTAWWHTCAVKTSKKYSQYVEATTLGCLRRVENLAGQLGKSQAVSPVAVERVNKASKAKLQPPQTVYNNSVRWQLWSLLQPRRSNEWLQVREASSTSLCNWRKGRKMPQEFSS